QKDSIESLNETISNLKHQKDSLNNKVQKLEQFYSFVEKAKESNEKYNDSLLIANEELRQKVNDTVNYFQKELDLCNSDYNNMFEKAKDSITTLNKKITGLKNQEPTKNIEYTIDEKKEQTLLDSITKLNKEIKTCNSDYNNMFEKAKDSITTLNKKITDLVSINNELSEEKSELEEKITNQQTQAIIAQNVSSNKEYQTKKDQITKDKTTTKDKKTNDQTKEKSYSVGELFKELNNNATLIYKENSETKDYINNCNLPAFTSFYKKTQKEDFDTKLRKTYFELNQENNNKKITEFKNLLVQAKNKQTNYLQQAKDNDAFSCEENREEFNTFFKTYQKTVEKAINLSK
ncbi:MAG: mitofilin family membrane protein, partial [Candidatus Nanoarchaeia archaeon]